MLKPPTAADLALAAKRAAFVSRHGLRDFKLSGRHLMRMVRRTCANPALVAAIRARFTRHYGCDLQMESRTWDHLEMLGKDGHLVALIAHPYSVSAEGREDMAVFRRAGLVVIEGGEAASWYGFGTTQIIVARPEFSGQVVRPAPPPPRPVAPIVRPPAETAYEARLRAAGPELLEIARDRACELAAALSLVACVGPRSGAPCVACAMRGDYERITRLIAEVEGFGP
jgi:hypothetical protein